MCLPYVKFRYQHHQNVVMRWLRYYVIQNEGHSALEMTTVYYVVEGCVTVDDCPIEET